MKKIITTLLITAMLLSLTAAAIIALTGCECKHDWSDANCIYPRMCSKCGAIEGEKAAHTYGNDGRCTFCGIDSHTAGDGHYYNAQGVCSCGDITTTYKLKLNDAAKAWAQFTMYSDYDIGDEKAGDLPVELILTKYSTPSTGKIKIEGKAIVALGDKYYVSLYDVVMHWDDEDATYYYDDRDFGTFLQCNYEGDLTAYYYTSMVSKECKLSTSSYSKARKIINFYSWETVSGSGAYDGCLYEYDYSGNCVDIKSFSYKIYYTAPQKYTSLYASIWYEINFGSSSAVAMGYTGTDTIVLNDETYR